jgi:hypothetical protein
MGNSSEHFIGPETPGVPANCDQDGKFTTFRDSAGKVLRQGARFRIFEYDEATDGALSNPREVKISDEVIDIEWRVHIANRKSSFFVFSGQKGAEDNYIARSKLAPDLHFKEDPDRTNLRNANVPADERSSRLEIDPGEKLISKRQPTEVELQNINTNIPITSLGTLRLDGEGRLIVLGGYGQSQSTESPPRQIDEYASNDTWFDDAGDGSVKARIIMNDGSHFDADPAWVLVGPPKFAPIIGNVVSLYDTLWDTAVREVAISASTPETPALVQLREQKGLWAASGSKSLSGFKPSFLHDIYPLLRNAINTRSVHVSGNGNDNYHHSIRDWGALAVLTGPDAENAAETREAIFDWIRDPNATEPQWKKMPRGLGDDHESLESEPPAPSLSSFLTLTQIQFAILREWALGNFNNDWPGSEPALLNKADPTPDELDRAATENSVGGPFYPGIEVSWLIRVKGLYSEPFRLKIPREPAAENTPAPLVVGALELRPGFFSQQMAVPWQADFYDCHKERFDDPEGNELYFMWWTAQRPDDVFPSGETERQRWVRTLGIGAELSEFDDLSNNDRFTKMQKNWDKLKFIIVKKDGYYEEEL